MDNADSLIVPLLQGFSWFDDGLQAYLEAKGWPQATRPQSMVMIHVVRGITRPIDIARSLGVSRQAIHTTISQMIELDLLALEHDSIDGRSKRVVITPNGLKMRAAANDAMLHMAAALEDRIGARCVEAMRHAFAADWGPPLTTFD